MLNGADISHWQGSDFDVTQHDFIIAKATEGRSYTDELFNHNIEKTLKANKLIGAYHYARPENGNSAKDEANHFVNIVKPLIGKCLLALDWEGEALHYPIDWAVEWLNEVERLTGVKPLIYCSASYLPKCGKVAENGNGVWVAKWSDTAPNVKPTFSVMALWQYTSTPYDKDKFFGDANAWSKYCETRLPLETEDGEHSCGCSFCEEFNEFLANHGYVKE